MKAIDYIIVGLKEFFGRSKDPDRYPTETIWDALERALKEGYLSDEERAIFEEAKKAYLTMVAELSRVEGALDVADDEIVLLNLEINDLVEFIKLLENKDGTN